jgi:hypothetical protein
VKRINLAVGFFSPARSGGGAGLSSFIRKQLNDVEDTIAGNAAGMI